MKSSTKCDGLGRDEVTDTLGDEGDVERDNVQVTGEARSCGWAPDTALIEAVTASFNGAIREKPRFGYRKLEWQRTMFTRNMIYRLGAETPSLRSLDDMFDRMASHLSLRDNDEDEANDRSMTRQEAAAFCRFAEPPEGSDGTWMTEEEAAAYCGVTGETIRMWEAESKNGVHYRALVYGPYACSYEYWIPRSLARIQTEG